MTEGSPPVKHLVENNTYRPNVDFVRNHLTRSLREAFRSLVPVSASSKGGELNLITGLFNLLAEAKVTQLDLSLVEKDVLRFKVIMDDLRFLLAQVKESLHDLLHNHPGFLLRDDLPLLQKVREVRPSTAFEYCAEGFAVYLDVIEERHYPVIVQALMNVNFEFDVIHLHALSPGGIESMDLAGHIRIRDEVVSLEYLGVPSLSQQAKNDVSTIGQCLLLLLERIEEPRVLFILHPLHFHQVIFLLSL